MLWTCFSALCNTLHHNDIRLGGSPPHAESLNLFPPQILGLFSVIHVFAIRIASPAPPPKEGRGFLALC